MNSVELSGFCLHLLCTAGEGSFEFNGRHYRIGKNDLVVIVGPDRVKKLSADTCMRVEWFMYRNFFIIYYILYF